MLGGSFRSRSSRGSAAGPSAPSDAAPRGRLNSKAEEYSIDHRPDSPVSAAAASNLPTLEERMSQLALLNFVQQLNRCTTTDWHRAGLVGD